MTDVIRALPRFVVVVAALALLSCSPAADSDAGPDGGEACNPNLPPASDPCLEDQCGNELGVGQPCTKGGGECSDWSFTEAWLCTADFSDTSLWFCTKTCVEDVDCGSGAGCAIDPDDPGAGAGCVPNTCNDDNPPTDAGPTDAG